MVYDKYTITEDISIRFYYFSVFEKRRRNWIVHTKLPENKKVDERIISEETAKGLVEGLTPSIVFGYLDNGKYTRVEYLDGVAIIRPHRGLKMVLSEKNWLFSFIFNLFGR